MAPLVLEIQVTPNVGALLFSVTKKRKLGVEFCSGAFPQKSTCTYVHAAHLHVHGEDGPMDAGKKYQAVVTDSRLPMHKVHPGLESATTDLAGNVLMYEIKWPLIFSVLNQMATDLLCTMKMECCSVMFFQKGHVHVVHMV